MSTHSTDAIHISRRYATAIFALSVEGKNEATVVEEFLVLARAIEGSPELAEALMSPMVAHGQKAQALAALIAKANAITKRAVNEVAEAGRSALIPAIATQLREELGRRQGELEATITSARALPAATQKQLSQSLATATGKKVKLTLKEDASVLGGLRIELGSLRLDATLSGALNNMRQQLLATTN